LVIATCATQAAASRISRPGRAMASAIVQINDRRTLLAGIDLVMCKRTCQVAAGIVVHRR
jgi:hypothetical protein